MSPEIYGHKYVMRSVKNKESIIIYLIIYNNRTAPAGPALISQLQARGSFDRIWRDLNTLSCSD
jgi:hypothetical protein